MLPFVSFGAGEQFGIFGGKACVDIDGGRSIVVDVRVCERLDVFGGYFEGRWGRAVVAVEDLAVLLVEDGCCEGSGGHVGVAVLYIGEGFVLFVGEDELEVIGGVESFGRGGDCVRCLLG